MKQTLSVFIASLFAAGGAAAQTSAPAPAPTQSAAPASTPAQPKPPARPLILRLDEIDGPRITVGPSATEKPPEKELPALGGPPSKAWERSPERTFPKDTAPGS
jgi:hypothetical protein